MVNKSGHKKYITIKYNVVNNTYNIIKYSILTITMSI